jgi:transposase
MTLVHALGGMRFLPHRSRAMRAWLNCQRSWLVVERLPAYAPELNPTEGLWSSLKGR